MRWRFRSSGLFLRLLMLCLAAALLVQLVAIAGVHIYRTERDTNRFPAVTSMVPLFSDTITMPKEGFHLQQVRVEGHQRRSR